VRFRNVSCVNYPFPQALCSPLVEKLGLEYAKKDSADITQLRTLAVGAAATVGDPALVILYFDLDWGINVVPAVPSRPCLNVSPSISLVIPLPSQ
jgi:hypothetical protein